MIALWILLGIFGIYVYLFIGIKVYEHFKPEHVHRDTVIGLWPLLTVGAVFIVFIVGIIFISFHGFYGIPHYVAYKKWPKFDIIGDN